MEHGQIILRKQDMRCGKCVLNVLTALSSVENIASLDISLKDRVISLKYADSKIDKGNLKALIDSAIVSGRENCPDAL